MSETKRERVIWFCKSCRSANPFFDAEFESTENIFGKTKEGDPLDCRDCGDSLVAECLIFNIETYAAIVPEWAQDRPVFPYFKSGGVGGVSPSVRYPIWSND
jgi:hypothetical protein